MSELAVTMLRFGYLALLWVFVAFALSALRQDLYSSTRVTSRTPRGAGPAPRRGAGAPARAGSAPLSRSAARRTPGRLIVTDGPLSGTSVPLTRNVIVLGRDQACTLVLDDEYASSRHARIFPSGENWVLEDLGSTNGTFLDGQQMAAPSQLAVGSQVRIGQTLIEVAA